MTNKDYRLLEYLCEKYSADVIEESILRKLAPAAVATGIALGGVYTANSLSHRNVEHTPQKIEVTQNIPIEDQIPHYHELVQAVKNYINWAVGCTGHTYDEVEVKPETLVEKAYEYEYDLPMLLSAFHLESGCGVTPRAKRTRSPFSIGCWDDNRNRAYYLDQNDAVESYIKIMQDKFIRGRRYTDAFADGGLVNGIGKRYASSTKYERDLRRMRQRAIDKFPDLEYLSYYD